MTRVERIRDVSTFRPVVQNTDPSPPFSDRFVNKFCSTCREYGVQYFFEDVVGAPNGAGGPAPVYTGSGPNYTYITIIKQTEDQKWFIGTATNGDGYEVFDGGLEYYQDHGSTHE